MTWKNLISCNERREKNKRAILCCTHSTELSRNRLCFRRRMEVKRITCICRKVRSLLPRIISQYEFSLLTAIETTLLPLVTQNIIIITTLAIVSKKKIFEKSRHNFLSPIVPLLKSIAAETFNKLFIHQRARVVAVYSVSMIEEVINVNPRNTSSLPPNGLIETIPSRQGLLAFQPHTPCENPLYPRSPLIAGEEKEYRLHAHVPPSPQASCRPCHYGALILSRV